MNMFSAADANPSPDVQTNHGFNIFLNANMNVLYALWRKRRQQTYMYTQIKMFMYLFNVGGAHRILYTNIYGEFQVHYVRLFKASK